MPQPRFAPSHRDTSKLAIRLRPKPAPESGRTARFRPRIKSYAQTMSRTFRDTGAEQPHPPRRSEGGSRRKSHGAASPAKSRTQERPFTSTKPDVVPARTANGSSRAPGSPESPAARELVYVDPHLLNRLMGHRGARSLGSPDWRLKAWRYRQIVKPPCRVLYRHERKGKKMYVVHVMRGRTPSCRRPGRTSIRGIRLHHHRTNSLSATTNCVTLDY